MYRIRLFVNLFSTGLLFPTNTIHQVIVDESRSLQVGVTNCTPEEFESPLFHILAHGVRFGRGDWNLTHGPKSVDNRFPVGKERERVIIKTSKLFLQSEK